MILKHLRRKIQTPQRQTKTRLRMRSLPSSGITPYEEIIKSYVRHFPDREVPPLNGDTRFLMKIASMANHELFEIDGWERYFETVKGLPFLMGENPAGWRPPFKWLINPENIKHVKKGFFAPDGPVSILQEGKDIRDIKADLPGGSKATC